MAAENKINKGLEDFLRGGWKVEEDVDGTGFYGIGSIVAPSGICYWDKIYSGELEKGYEEC